YHELRVTKRPPLEALREAQLKIYRNPDPEWIKDLAGERGRVNQEKAVKASPAPPQTKPGEAPRTMPTKLWAAFVLTGRGEASAARAGWWTGRRRGSCGSEWAPGSGVCRGRLPDGLGDLFLGERLAEHAGGAQEPGHAEQVHLAAVGAGHSDDARAGDL